MNVNKKPIVFTGITPTGKLTLGHYFGVIKELLDLQENYEIIIMIADLHAITNAFEEKIDYRKNSKEMASTLYACGLDIEKCKVFIQSEISEHLELSYFLSPYCSTNRLANMIQYKEKSKRRKLSSLSLFYYPVLMASDILMYDAEIVMVGKDQKQHLEFSKYIAENFNHRNNNILKIPNFSFSKKGSKIMGLQDPLKKMSKSSNDNISLLEEKKSVEKKIMKSVTDSENKIFFDEKNKPGISNLLTIYSCISNCEISDSENFFSDKDYFYLKLVVAQEINLKLEKIKDNIKKVSKNIDQILFENCRKLKLIAKKKIELVKKNILI